MPHEQQSIASLVLPIFWKWFRSGVFLAALMFFYYMVFSEGLNKSMNKFEIKMAKSIEQRLDDVKGIDEIKDEINDVIRVIRNPQQYNDKGAK